MRHKKCHYLYVRERNNQVEAALQKMGAEFRTLSINAFSQSSKKPRIFNLVFAEGDALLGAVLAGWCVELRPKTIMNWNGESGFEKKTCLPPKKEKFDMHSVPNFFDVGPLNAIQNLFLKILWPALGQQERFNQLLFRAIGNLENIIESREIHSEEVVRKLVLMIAQPNLTSVQSPHKRVHRNRGPFPNRASLDTRPRLY